MFKKLFSGLVLILFSAWLLFPGEDAGIVGEEELLSNAENYSAQMEKQFSKKNVLDAIKKYRKAEKIYRTFGKKELQNKLAGKAHSYLKNLNAEAVVTYNSLIEEGNNLLLSGETPARALSRWEEALLVSRLMKDKTRENKVLSLLAKITEEEEMYSKTIVYNKQLGEGKDKKTQANISLKLAKLYRETGNTNRTQDAVRYCRKLMKELNDSRGLAELKCIDAEILLLTGDTSNAEKLFNEALAELRNFKMEKEEAEALKGLGAVSKLSGDYEKSGQYYDEARAIYLKYKMALEEGRVCLALAEMTKARVRDIKNNPQAGATEKSKIKILEDRAGAYLQTTLKLFIRVEKKSVLSEVYYALGLFYLEKSDFTEALKYFKQSLEQNKKTGNAARQAKDQFYLGLAFLANNDTGQAIDYLERAKQIQTNTLDAGEWLTDLLLARAYDKNAESEQAGQAFLSSIKNIETMRTKVAEEESKTAFLGRKIGAYHESVSFFYDLYEKQGKKAEYAEEAFNLAERCKARVLLEQIAEKKIEFGKHLVSPETLTEEEKKIRAVLSLKDELYNLAMNNASLDDLEEKREETGRRDTELKNFLSELKIKFPFYSALKYPEPVLLSSLPLDKNEVVIEYLVTNEAVFSWVIRTGKKGNTIEAFYKTRMKNTELEEMVDRLLLPFVEIPLYGTVGRVTLTGTRGLKVRAREKVKPPAGAQKDEIMQEEKIVGVYDAKLAYELYEKIVGPHLSEIPEKAHIIFIPDGVLHILPFSCLVTEQPEKEGPLTIDALMNTRGLKVTAREQKKERTQDNEIRVFEVPKGAYLFEKRRFSNYQSASVLALLRGVRNPEKPGKAFFGLGDPIFNEEDGGSETRGIKIAGRKTRPQVTASPKPETPYNLGEDFGRLENTNDEITKIAEVLNVPVKEPDILLRELAQELKLKKQNLSDYRYFHLATHGILGNEKTEIRKIVKEPALLLCLTGNRQGEDGILTMSEVLGLKLNAELVVLSACKTGLGKNLAGEGIAGLSRAFMLAGTGSVLASLWEIDDIGSAIFMQNFYKGLKDGKTKSDSMYQAAREVMKERSAHPYFWAPFTLIGEWQ